MTTSTKTNKPDLSIVIVSYNTCELILKCLESLFTQRSELKLEVIVVDNNSSDDSVSKIKQHYPSVNLLQSKKNEGFARANNIAFDQCSSDYVLMLNPDTEVGANCLQTSLSHIQKHHNIGALGCRVLLESGKQQSTIFRFLNLKQLFYAVFVNDSARRRYTWFGDARYAALSRDQVQKVDVIAGCFMLVPLSVIKLTGGMDRHFFMYGEEAEWCYRIKQHNFTIEYFPTAEIMHHGAASSNHLTEWKMIEMARGQLILLMLTRGAIVAQAGNLLMLFATVPRIAYFLVLALKKNVNTARESYPILSKFKFHLAVLFNPKAELQYATASKPQ